jgi:hypothetical protein
VIVKVLTRDAAVQKPVPVQIPRDATKFFSAIASYEASQLDKYFTSLSASFLIHSLCNGKVTW